MLPEEAIRCIEIAEITINGKDTYKERIGDFRETVKSALRKRIAKEPDDICLIDKYGYDRDAVICPCCSEEITFAVGGIRYCPFCGQKLSGCKERTGKIIWRNDGFLGDIK